MPNDSDVLAIIHAIKSEIAVCEKETARAKISDLYAHGRLQGKIDGLESSIALIDLILSGKEDDDR
jgi:hypothetical protein